MNGESRLARRYHWLSETVSNFVEAPHTAIDGRSQGEIVNLTDRRAAASRRGQLDLLRDLGPDRIVREAAALDGKPVPPPPPEAPLLPHLVMPAHHDVRPKDVILRRLHGAAWPAAAERGPSDFADLLLVPGVGARTVRSLAMVAEVVHGAPCRFADPARFSLAHGGKDRHPYPVPTKVYDQTIAVLKSAITQAKLGNDERLDAIRRPRPPGTASRTQRERPVTACIRRRGNAALARLWRPQRLRLGASGVWQGFSVRLSPLAPTPPSVPAPGRRRGKPPAPSASSLPRPPAASRPPPTWCGRSAAAR